MEIFGDFLSLGACAMFNRQLRILSRCSRDTPSTWSPTSSTTACLKDTPNCSPTEGKLRYEAGQVGLKKALRVKARRDHCRVALCHLQPHGQTDAGIICSHYRHSGGAGGKRQRSFPRCSELLAEKLPRPTQRQLQFNGQVRSQTHSLSQTDSRIQPHHQLQKAANPLHSTASCISHDLLRSRKWNSKIIWIFPFASDLCPGETCYHFPRGVQVTIWSQNYSSKHSPAFQPKTNLLSFPTSQLNKYFVLAIWKGEP